MKKFETIWKSGYVDNLALCPECREVGRLLHDFEFLGSGFYRCKKCWCLLKELDCSEQSTNKEELE